MKTELAAKATDIRDEIITLISSMESISANYKNFPLPDKIFSNVKSELERNNFNLVVCGKVKHGKSSLINALIGKEILPVSNDVATSCIFKITDAMEESFFIVYDNGDTEEITLQDLSSYGSQTVIDTEGLITSDSGRSMAYIQINTKLDFVPQGVSIIDTPGIGSTYPLHSQITKNYIQYADAVLYVLNPSPIEDIEVSFLSEVYDITPNILYTTTKIDENPSISVKENTTRNLDILNKKFGDKVYKQIEMTQMSSVQLLQSAQSDDEILKQAYYEDSCFEEVKTKLLELIFLTQGYFKSSIAYNEAVKYQNEVSASLDSQLTLALSTGSEREKLITNYNEAKRHFDENLSESKQREFNAQIEMRLNAVEGDFRKKFNIIDGPIAIKYYNEIDQLTDTEMDGYVESLNGKLVEDIQKEWEEICSIVQYSIHEVLVNYQGEYNIRTAFPIQNTKESDKNELIYTPTIGETVKSFKNYYITGGIATGAVFTVAQATVYLIPTLATPLAPVIAPVVLLMGVGTLVWGAIKGKGEAKKKALEKTKSNLKKFVGDTISGSFKQLTEVSLVNNQFKSMYHGFILSVREEAISSMKAIFIRYRDELESMKTVINNSENNIKTIDRLEKQKVLWKQNENRMLEIKKKFSSIEL